MGNGLQMKYFVLNPHKDNAYGRASRRALFAYAQEIAPENAEMASDLFHWLDDIAETSAGKERGDGE